MRGARGAPAKRTVPIAVAALGPLLPSLLLAVSAPDPVAAAPAAVPASSAPLRWAADAEGGAPYIFKDPKNPGRNIGFEVDLAAALAKELGRPIVFEQYDYKSLIPGVLRGDFDFAMNGIEVTPDRKAHLLFSRPYYIFRLQLVTRAGETRFTTLEECRALHGVVGTLEDTAAERLLDQMGIAKKVYDGQVEPYRDLTLRRLDAVLLDLPIAVYYAQPNRELKFAGEPIGRGYYAIAFRPGQEPLAAAFDAALGRLLQRGDLRAIYQKWGIWNEDQSELLNASVGDILAESRRQWTFARYFPLLLEGAWLTVRLSFSSFFLAMALGLVVAVSRLYGPLPLRWAAVGYVEFFRGIPVLLLLYFLYYGLADLSTAYGLEFLKLAPLEAAIAGLGLNYGAYEAEIYRAGISAIPVGQWEAAASLGMTPVPTFRRIILPQAIRIILPPMTGDFVALFKDTSIVSMIAVVELSKQYQILSKSSMKYLEIGLLTALLYLVMSVPLGALSRRLEKVWGKGIHG